MSDSNYKQVLIEIYQQSHNVDDIFLPENTQHHLDCIIKRMTQNKGVYTVLITLSFYKYLHPKQDIRQHKIELTNGFSGRSFDFNYVTPTLKELGLPAMAESGWLTRSLEQAYPYDKKYNGKIRPDELKTAFLEMVDFIQKSKDNALEVLKLLLNGGIQFKENNKVIIQKITLDDVQINHLISLLQEHFEYRYQTHGGSKLPVLAFYAIYTVLIDELGRFKDCNLSPLGSHTASDRTSNSGGDIEIFKDNQLFEAVEIKLDKEPTAHMVRVAYDKINKFGITRYYILSAIIPSADEQAQIDNLISQIKQEHGCQVIVNGLYPSLKYYLRLISNPKLFLNKYIELVEQDKELQLIHKEQLKLLLNKYFS